MYRRFSLRQAHGSYGLDGNQALETSSILVQGKHIKCHMNWKMVFPLLLINLFIHLFIYLSIYRSIYLLIYRPIDLSSFYHTNKRKKRKGTLTGTICSMARSTELGSNLSVAVREKNTNTDTNTSGKVIPLRYSVLIDLCFARSKVGSMVTKLV